MKLFIAIYLALFIHVTRASFVQNINYGGGRVIDTTKCTGRCTSSIHVIADNAFVGGIKYSDKRKDVLIDHEEVDVLRRSMETLDYPKVLQHLASYCQTEPAKNIIFQSSGQYTTKTKHLATSTATPLSSPNYEGVIDRYDAILEYDELLYTGVKQPSFASDLNFGPILKSASDGAILECEDIREISRGLSTVSSIVDWLEEIEKINKDDTDGEKKYVQIPQLGMNVCLVDDSLRDLLATAFDDEGKLSGLTFPKLGQLRKEVAIIRKQILSKIDGLMKSPQFSRMLSVEGSYFSEVNGRFVLPVQPTHKNAVGIVHDTSRTGKTVYVEPKEIVEPTNEMKQTEVFLKQEESRILRSLTSKIMQNRDDIERALEAAAQIDLLVAKSRLQSVMGGIVPEVKNEGVVNVVQASHPVLLLKGNDVVPNDISLGKDENSGLVLSGPNSGGKTIILKLLGLLSMMCRDGIPLPIKSGRVDYFFPVLADIGDMQNVNEDLSTFSGHLLVCKNVLERSSKNSLVLMDEMGSGTDPKQGVALARSLLEGIVNKGAKVAITTHYYELKQFAAEDSRFSIAGMEFDNGYPTYKMVAGKMSESYAIAVAQRLKLPSDIVERAEELLDEETRRLGTLLTELEEKKAEIEVQKLLLVAKETELDDAQRHMERIREDLERKRKNVRQEEAHKFTKKLEEKEKEIREIMKSLEEGASKKKVERSMGGIRSMKKDVLDAVDPNSKPVYADLPADSELKLGQTLLIKKEGQLYQRTGTIVKMTPKFIEISLGFMTQRMKRNDLTLPVDGVASGRKVISQRNPIPKAVRRAAKLAEDEQKMSVVSNMSSGGGKKNVVMRTESNTIDLRGCSLVEAKELSIDLFSKNMNAGTVFLLHGHGESGVLKKKLRQWLKNERDFVKRFLPAAQEDGGDAYTLVHLKSLF